MAAKKKRALSPQQRAKRNKEAAAKRPRNCRYIKPDGTRCQKPTAGAWCCPSHKTGVLAQAAGAEMPPEVEALRRAAHVATGMEESLPERMRAAYGALHQSGDLISVREEIAAAKARLRVKNERLAGIGDEAETLAAVSALWLRYRFKDAGNGAERDLEETADQKRYRRSLDELLLSQELGGRWVSFGDLETEIRKEEAHIAKMVAVEARRARDESGLIRIEAALAVVGEIAAVVESFYRQKQIPQAVMVALQQVYRSLAFGDGGSIEAEAQRALEISGTAVEDTGA